MTHKHVKCFATVGLTSALLAAGAAQCQESESVLPPADLPRQFYLMQIKEELQAQVNALAEQKRIMASQEKKNSLQRKSLDLLKKQLAAQKHELDETRARLEAMQTQIDKAALKADTKNHAQAEQQAAQVAEPGASPNAASADPSPADAPRQAATQSVTTEQQQIQIAEKQPQPVAQPTPPPDQAAKPTSPQTATALAQTEPAPAQPVGQPPQQSTQNVQPAVAPIFDQPGVLTPHRKIVLEPSLQYSYSSTYRVALLGYTVVPAIHIGVIDIRGVNNSTWIGAMTARYGVTNRFELEFKLPYVSRTDATITRSLDPSADSVFNTSGNGLGDAEFAARYQLNDGSGDRPYYIAGLRLKLRNGKDPFSVPFTTFTSSSGTVTQMQAEQPTGSGFVAWQPSFSFIYPTDPAVFFGGINYVKNIDRDVGGGQGVIHPGNAVGMNFGMGLALNEKASFSIGIEYTSVGIPSADNSNLQFPAATPTQLATLLFGYSYRTSPKSSINFSIGAGLTPDTPGVTLMLRIPITIDRAPVKNKPPEKTVAG